ncbi:hypothetical protein HRbin39_01203 [bacterium HR39]|nr:hypothetical protein HRbin39_01203 [bacterium HR39]
MTIGRLALSALLGATVLAGTAASAAERQVTEQGITYTIVDDSIIPESLTGRPGDPEKGRQWFVDRRLGNCLACHAVSALADEPYHGNVGPSLDGVGAALSEGVIRLRIVDPKVVNPDTIMPAFFRSTGLWDVRKDHEGKTILTAEQVEDIVAFLKTLK